MQLLLDRHPSPLGELLIVTDETGRLRALDFDDCGPRLQRLLSRHYPGHAVSPARRDVEAAVPAAPVEAAGAIRRTLDRYFDGDLTATNALPTGTGGTLFQREVWSALRTIPAGSTVSYGALAATLGRAGSSRAVGLANGANPIAIVVPCHRVIGADGSLTGFGGGLWRKRWLLAHERSAAQTPRPAAP